MPKKGCIDRVFEFLNRHLNSLNSHVAKYRQVNFVHGNVINILGKEYIIIHINDNQLVISNINKDLENTVIKFLSSYLTQKIVDMATKICRKIGVSYNNLSKKCIVNG